MREVIHKSIGRWTEHSALKKGVAGTHRVACDQNQYWLDTDPPSVSRLWPNVTCKKCLNKKGTTKWKSQQDLLKNVVRS